ncbi:MAG: DMT family transporter [Cyanobacteria bacterium P01_E01_bin.42]
MLNKYIGSFFIQKNNAPAILSLLMAVIAMAWIAIFLRFLEEEISSFAAAFNGVLFATVFLGIWNGIQSQTRQSSPDKTSPTQIFTSWILLQLIIAGICFAGDQILWAWSLTKTSVANSTLLTNLNPLWTTFLGWSIWKRYFDNKFLIGMVIAMIGVFLIGVEDLQIFTGNLQGDGTAIAASVCFSVYLLIVEKLRESLSSETILFGTSLFSTLSILPIILIMGEQVFPHSLQSWIFVILLGFICQVLGQGLVNYCLKTLSSGFVAIALLLQPIITAILAWLIFSEKLSLSNSVAFAVVLLGIYLAQSSSSAVKE